MFRILMRKLKERYNELKAVLFTKKKEPLNPWDRCSWEKFMTEDGRVGYRINLSRLSPVLQRALWKRLGACQICGRLHQASRATEFVNKGDMTLRVMGYRDVKVLFDNVLRGIVPHSTHRIKTPAQKINAVANKSPIRSNQEQSAEVEKESKLPSVQERVYTILCGSWRECPGHGCYLPVTGMKTDEEQYLRKLFDKITTDRQKSKQSHLPWQIIKATKDMKGEEITNVYVNTYFASLLPFLLSRMAHEIGQKKGFLVPKNSFLVSYNNGQERAA